MRGFIGLLTLSSSFTYAMDERLESQPEESPIRYHVPITVSKELVSDNVKDKFCEHYPDLHCEAVKNKWIFQFDEKMSNDLIERFQVDLKFFTENPSTPLENILCCFENYEPKNESQKELLSWAQKLITYEGPKACGLFITGSVGVGKTHISIAIAKKLQQAGQKVLFIQPKEISKRFSYSALKSLWIPNTILIFDDFNGAEAFENDLIREAILGAFNKGGYKIFITSNRSYKNFMERVPEGLEKERFLDRSKNIFKVIEVEGESNRNPVGWFNDM